MSKFSETELERISFMKAIAVEISKNEPAVLKGGTALLLTRGLDRFSEDMDFNLPKGTTSDFKKYIMDAAKTIGIDVDYINIKKDTDTTKRYMVHYSSDSTKDYPLKIECSMREDISKDDVEKIENINVYTVKRIAELKTNAFINRNRGRDTYDIAFLVEKYPTEISEETWKRIDKHIRARGIDDLLRAFEKEKEDDTLLAELDGTEVLLKLQEALDKRKTEERETTEHEETSENAQDSKDGALRLEAVEDKLKAQYAQGIIAAARVEIPRGMDFNLPNADLNGVQETVVSSLADGEREVKDLQSDATAKEAEAVKIGRQTAILTAKGIMGKGAIVTGTANGGMYHGEIIAKTDIYAIQRIDDNRAVLHEIKDLSDKTNVEVGAKITLHKQHDKTITVREDSQEEELEDENERERGSR